MKGLSLKTALLWGGIALVVLGPLALAAASPLQASRAAPYIVASLAGVAALGLLTLHPLLARGLLPQVARLRQRRWHSHVGRILVVLVGLHIAGLYITSPPDALDALLLASPTPFSVYGVVAMWGLILTALLAASRRRLGLRDSLWRAGHTCLGVIVVAATIIHAVQIEGTMVWWSKVALCLTATLSLAWVLWVRHVRRR